MRLTPFVVFAAANAAAVCSSPRVSLDYATYQRTVRASCVSEFVGALFVWGATGPAAGRKEDSTSRIGTNAPYLSLHEKVGKVECVNGRKDSLPQAHNRQPLVWRNSASSATTQFRIHPQQYGTYIN